MAEEKKPTDTHGAKSTKSTEKILPIIAAALIAGGTSLVGSLFGGGSARGETHDPERIPDPFRDELTRLMGERYEGLVGEPRPGYEGELTAGYNPALLAAMQNVMSLSGGARGQSAYGGDIQGLLERFTSPSGAMGWNPGNAHWRNIPQGGGGQSPSQGWKPPMQVQRPTGRQQPTGGA